MNDTQTPTESSDSVPLLAARLEAIGPYRLKEIVGEGGMGSVYRAEQTEPVWREVAIKVTRIDLGSAGSLARFEAERQILATLNHPNIAQVYEAGATPDGFPYMVMEFIDGVGLRHYCDQKQLGLRARIALFIDVCGAVQYAHQRGVIHRDIKPSNVLVDDRSGSPVPKLIDFGIAKLVAAAPGEQTRAGAVLGTPVYMSPEQINAAADVDTRTDVYSLGVVLYQLLSGMLPRGDDDSTGSSRWQIEANTPAPRPSRRLGHASDIAVIANKRATSPDALKRSLSNELDWIVLRAMAPEREQRYGSAAELANDLQRYLDGRPVEARPPSRGYVIRKFVGRHRLETALAIVLLLAVTVSALFVVNAWRDERQAHQQADLAARQASAVNDFLLDMLGAPDPRVSGRDVRVVDVLEKASDKARDEFPDQPLVRAALLETLGRSYAGLAEQDRAAGMIREALQLRRDAAGTDSELALETENELNEAEFPLVPIAEMRARMEDLYNRAVPALGETHPVSLTALNNFGTALVFLAGDQDEAGEKQMLNKALTIQRRNLELRNAVYGADDSRTTHARNNLATTLQQLGMYAEAEPLFRDNLQRQLRLYGEDNHYTLTTIDNLALDIEQQGRLDEALPLYARALDGLRRVNGIDHPTTLQTQTTFGQALLETSDRRDEGVVLLKEVLQLNATRDPDDYNTRNARQALIDAGEEIQAPSADTAPPPAIDDPGKTADATSGADSSSEAAVH